MFRKPSVMQTYKVVDDYENMIYDPVQQKHVPGHKRIIIDGLTGEELTPETLESPLSRVQRLTQQSNEQIKSDLANEITLAKANGQYSQPWLANVQSPKKHMVLSEYVKGVAETANTDVQSGNSIFGASTSQVTTDIPGSLYAQLANQEIENMKAQGHRYAFINIDVASAMSTTFAEFKALLKDKGYEVNTSEIAFTSSGPTYKVLITW